MASIGGTTGNGGAALPQMGNYWHEKPYKRPVDLHKLAQAAKNRNVVGVAKALHAPVRTINGRNVVLDGGGVPINLGKLAARLAAEGAIRPKHKKR